MKITNAKNKPDAERKLKQEYPDYAATFVRKEKKDKSTSKDDYKWIFYYDLEKNN